MQLVVMSLPAASLALSARIARNLSGWDQLGGGRSETAQMLALFVEKVVDVKPVLLYLKVVDSET
jgi:hypothetical protein